MIKNYKREKIAPINLFFILVISRIIISLNYAQSVSVGKIKTDMLISIGIGAILTLVFSLPALFAVKSGKNPLSIKWMACLYAIYYIYLAGINITRFSYFATTKLNPDMVDFFLVIIITIGVTYAAFLGIESISRFTSFAVVILFVGIIFILAFNVQEFRIENFFPYISNTQQNILYNGLIMSSNTGEIAMFLCLAKKINAPFSKYSKSLIFAIIISFITTFIMFIFVIGVMGDFASLVPFPIYGLSQLAKIGDFRRLDALYSVIWIFAIFVKASVFLYCSAISFESLFKKKKPKHLTVCIICGVLVCAFATIEVMGFVSNWNNESKLIIIIPFVVFAVIFPIISLLFKKKDKGDDLIEKF